MEKAELTKHREHARALRKHVLGHVSGFLMHSPDPSRDDYEEETRCALQLQAIELAEIAELLRGVLSTQAGDMPDWLIHREAKRRMMLPSDHELPEPTGD